MFVFVIMPFQEELTKIYEDVVKPTLEAEGCSVQRADEFTSHQNILRTTAQGHKARNIEYGNPVADYLLTVVNLDEEITNNPPIQLENLAKEIEPAMYEMLKLLLNLTSSLSPLSSNFETHTKLVQLATDARSKKLYNHWC